MGGPGEQDALGECRGVGGAGSSRRKVGACLGERCIEGEPRSYDGGTIGRGVAGAYVERGAELVFGADFAGVAAARFEGEDPQIDIDVTAGVGGVPVDLIGEIALDFICEAREAESGVGGGLIDSRGEGAKLVCGGENARMFGETAIGAGKRGNGWSVERHTDRGRGMDG